MGGDYLEAAIDAAPTPRNLPQFVFKRLTLRGFVVYLDHLGKRQQFLDEVLPLVRDGRLRYRETVMEGLQNAPDALIGLLRGANTGKMLVRL